MWRICKKLSIKIKIMISFISEKLNGDINVTSPTGLKNYFDLTGINLAKKFWKEIKK